MQASASFHHTTPALNARAERLDVSGMQCKYQTERVIREQAWRSANRPPLHESGISIESGFARDGTNQCTAANLLQPLRLRPRRGFSQLRRTARPTNFDGTRKPGSFRGPGNAERVRGLQVEKDLFRIRLRLQTHRTGKPKYEVSQWTVHASSHRRREEVSR